MSEQQQDNTGGGPGNEAVEAATAKVQIAEYQNDRDYMTAYLAGDRGKVDEMTRLYAVAYREPGAPDATQTANQVQDAGEEWLARPSSIDDYDFSALVTEEPTAEQRALQIELKNALHAEGVPVHAVGVAMNVMAHNLKSGLPDERALEHSKLATKSELELRYGDKSAEILAAAGKMYERLEKRDPRIADLLDASGASNSVWMVETLARLWEQKYSKLRT